MIHSSEQESDLLLSDEEDGEFLRELAHRRMKAMKSANSNREMIYGTLYHCSHEREIVEATACIPSLVIHFTSPEFKRCKIMTEHLIELARMYECTRFMEIRAQEAPFLVAKMSIKVLPCVICIVDALAVDRIVGFEGLGGTDEFETKALEERLKKCKVLGK